MRRRKFLKGVGLGGIAATGSLLFLGGTNMGTSADVPEQGGPPNREGWTLTFHDRFQGDSLNREKWGIGWGWGWYTDTSPTRISPENISVTDGSLRLKGTHANDDIISGTVNTKNLASFGPGSYVEARIKFARRTGFLNAFWAKPISEVWPPEIDIVELFQSGNDENATQQSQHHLHYSTSARPGDGSTHTSVNTTSIPGGDLTEDFHEYGIEWRDDRIVHYVDGQPVGEWTDDTLLRAFNIDVPFYLMLSLNIGNFGEPDLSEEWGEEMVVDWVRIWQRQ